MPDPFAPPQCRARACKDAPPCGKPVERELEHDGLVTFLCRAHRVVVRMLAADYGGDYSKVPCRRHAIDKNERPQPSKCRYRRENVWGWEKMPT